VDVVEITSFSLGDGSVFFGVRKGSTNVFDEEASDEVATVPSDEVVTVPSDEVSLKTIFNHSNGSSAAATGSVDILVP